MLNKELSKMRKNIEKLQTFDLRYFLSRILFVDDGLQNHLIFQLLYDTLNRLTDTETFIAWSCLIVA